jgi:hypothetical protein
MLLLLGLATLTLAPEVPPTWVRVGKGVEVQGTGRWDWHPAPAMAKATAAELDFRIEEPATQTDGQELVAFAKYSGMGNLGGYEAGLRVGEHRVWLSSKWGEAVLWSRKGGILQVVACALKPKVHHRLRLTTRGGQARFGIDGKPLLAWTTKGEPRLELGVKEGKVRFTARRPTGQEIESAPWATGFREVPWHGQIWFFDGNEPLFTLAPGNRLDHMKLRSGHRPMLYAGNFATDWATCTPSKVESYKVLKSGSTLHLQVLASDPANRSSKCVSDLQVSKDARGFYTYDHRVLTTSQSKALEWDHGDPAFLGAVGDSETLNNDAYEPPVEWFLYDLGGRRVLKTPLNHNGHYVSNAFPGAGYYGQQGGRMVAFGKALIAPVLQVPPVAPEFKQVRLDTCFWAYDEHVLYTLGQPPNGPFETRAIYTAIPRTEAERLFQTAIFNEPIGIDRKVPVYSAGIGHTETFSKEVVLASPHREFRLWAGKLDKTVGRSDKSSLRIDGPSEAGTGIGISNYMSPWPERALITCWVRCEGDQTAPSIGIRRTDTGETRIYLLGDPKVRGWQKAEIVADFLANVPIAMVTFRNAGAGTVWFDDFKIQPAPPNAVATKPHRPAASAVLSWTAEDAAFAEDASGNGHAGKLFNVKHAQEDGLEFWSFGGRDSYAWPLPSPALDMAPPYTLDFDLRPHSEGPLIAYYFQFHFDLVRKGDRLAIEYRNGREVATSEPAVTPGKWQKIRIVALPDSIEFFVDGKSYGRRAAQVKAADWTLYQSGSWHRHPTFFGNGPGDLQYPPDFAACLKADVRSVRIARGR